MPRLLFLLISFCLLIPARVQSATYTFIKIADSSGVLKSFSKPSINQAGTVAFTANLDAGGQVIYTGSTAGGGLAPVASTSGGTFSSFGLFPTINAGGTVAFNASLSAGGSGVFAGASAGGTPATVAITGTTFNGFSFYPAISGTGTVAFGASLTGGGQGLFRGTSSGGVPSPVANPTGGTFSGFDSPAINGADTLAFGASLTGDGGGIYTSIAGGASSALVDRTGTFKLFGGHVAINDAGTVAFRGNLTTGLVPGIFTRDIGGSTTTTVATAGHGFSGFNSFISVNGSRIVAFQAILSSGGTGVFTGPDATADRVVAFSDPLFGSTVVDADIGNQSLNDSGQIVFSYSLLNGENGIAVATSGSTGGGGGGAAALKCRAAVVGAATTLASAEAKVLQKCEDSRLNGKLLAPCPDPKTSDAVNKATTKLRDGITKACCGKDKGCTGGGDDVALGDVGWTVGSCPNIVGGTCSNPIATGADVATCLDCLADAIAHQAIELSYGALIPANPKGTKREKALHKCQATIGRAATAVLIAQAKTLGKCWTTVNKLGTGTCPDAKTQATIDKAELTSQTAITKACCGADKTCGTADDFAPSEIGFVPTCLGVDPPGTIPACAGAISDMPSLVGCVHCVTEFSVDCLESATVPHFAPYPAECAP